MDTSCREYSISDLASEFSLTTRAIRFYEERGLLTPHREGQTRVYSPKDRVRLMLILRGKRLGMTLEESRELIDLYNPQSDNRLQLERLIDRIQKRRHELEQQRQEIQLTLRELGDAEARAKDSLQELNTLSQRTPGDAK